MTRIAEARKGAAIQLHAIARPFFHYPPLVKSAWFLPNIHVWEPWYGEPTTRYEERLWGKLVVPSAVLFVVPQQPGIDVSAFKRELQRKTGSEWHADDKDLISGLVAAIRLSKRIRQFDPVTNVGRSLYVPFDMEIPEGWEINDRPP